jgi:hyperosmotically inducible protein
MEQYASGQAYRDLAQIGIEEGENFMKINFGKQILAFAFGLLFISTLANAQGERQRIRNQIEKEVRHELVMLPYYSLFDWLQFKVNDDDSVVLLGQVTRPSTKSDAERRIKKLEEVSKVINQIEVLPPSPGDDRLRRRIYRELFSQNSPLFRYSIQAVPPIHIIIKNGRVALRGVVSSEADKRIAYVRVSTIPGIFEVKNELVVERD